jgi:hypothetical protein
MKKILLIALLTCSLVSAHATVTMFYGILSGANESPANSSPGIGFGIANFDPSAHTLQLLVNFSGLQGTTTASHIHAPTLLTLSGNAGVATTTPAFAGFPLGVTSGVYSNTLDLTLASSYNAAYITSNGGSIPASESALFSALLAGKAYLNIHTTAYGGGEIRGFLTAVPEPSTLALLGLCAVGMAARSWKKKRASKV